MPVLLKQAAKVNLKTCRDRRIPVPFVLSMTSRNVETKSHKHIGILSALKGYLAQPDHKVPRDSKGYKAWEGHPAHLGHKDYQGQQVSRVYLARKASRVYLARKALRGHLPHHLLMLTP